MDNAVVPPLWQSVVETAHSAGLTLEQFRDMAAKLFIEHSLLINKGNQSRTAKAMGIHRNTMSRTIRELQIVIVKPKKRSRRFRQKLSNFIARELQLSRGTQEATIAGD